MRRLVDRVLGRVASPALIRRRRAGRALILAYHNVLPPGEPQAGDRSLHLPWESFCAQLDALEAACRVVPLERLLDPVSDRRPRVALTFDDGYRGTVLHAVPELARRGLPATLFVAPGVLGDRSFWWDEVAEAAAFGEVPPRFRQAALAEFGGRADRIREGWRSRGLDLATVRLPATYRSATPTELDAAARAPGITLGAHSWSHPNLAALSEDELVLELARPLEWLRARCPQGTIPWLAYPYGLHTARVHGLAAHAGYIGGLKVEGGWLPRDAVPSFAMPRLNIPASLGPGRYRSHLAALPLP